MKELVLKGASYINAGKYTSTEAMHDHLNLMEKVGYLMAKDTFDLKAFVRLSENETEDEIDAILLVLGRSSYDYYSTLYLKTGVFEDNNPLGSLRDEYALGYTYKVNEMLELEKKGYRMKDKNGEAFSDRWEFKEQEPQQLLTIND